MIKYTFREQPSSSTHVVLNKGKIGLTNKLFLLLENLIVK